MNIEEEVSSEGEMRVCRNEGAGIYKSESQGLAL